LEVREVIYCRIHFGCWGGSRSADRSSSKRWRSTSPPLARATNSRDGADSRVGAAVNSGSTNRFVCHVVWRRSSRRRDCDLPRNDVTPRRIVSSHVVGVDRPFDCLCRGVRCSLPSPNAVRRPVEPHSLRVQRRSCGPSRQRSIKARPTTISALGFVVRFTRWPVYALIVGGHWIAL